MHEYYPQIGGYEPPSAADRDVVPLTDVVDVDGDRRVSTDTVFLHQRDHLENGKGLVSVFFFLMNNIKMSKKYMIRFRG